MKPIKNWENIKASGDFESLPGGGQICKIMGAKEKSNKNTNGTHLELMLEIAEGEYKGFFERDYRAQSGEEKYWRGIINQNIPNETSEKYDMQCGFFKRFTDAIEESNSGYHWDWNEAGLKGKLCGCVFGEKERESKRGTIYMATYANEIVPVADIKSGKFKVPDIKKLDTKKQSSSAKGFAELQNSDEELPF